MGPKISLISPSLLDEGSESVRGHIECCSTEAGISGWAVDVADPARTLTIQLLIDDVLISECQTNIRRPDIGEPIKTDVSAGFHFPDDVFQQLAKLAIQSSAPKILMRVGGTALVFPSSINLTAAKDALGLQAAVKEMATGPDIQARLTDLRSTAVAFAERPLQRSQDGVAGVIEVLCAEEAGWIWMAGWMRRSASFESPVVLVDRQKIPGGFVFAAYERSDIHSGAFGFVGVMHIDWRPTASSDPNLHFGEHCHLRMTCVKPIRLIQWRDFLQFFDTMKEGFSAGYSDALQMLVSRPDSWNLDDAKSATSEANLDHVLVLPDFGCLVSGWAISLLRPIEAFILKLGSSILSCDPNSLFFKSRPDLKDIFPGYDKLTLQAGFTAVFRGYVSFDNLDAPLLRFQFSDGSFDNHAVNVRSLRHLGRATAVDTVLDLYPSIASEAFFPDFVAAVRDQARREFTSSRPHVLNPASEVVVFALPEDRSEIFLLFEEITNSTGNYPSSLGFVFISGAGSFRSDIVALFTHFRNSGRSSCSLLFVADPAEAFHALPDVLAKLSVRSFIFIGPYVHLSVSGWKEALRYLNSGSESLHFFEILDPLMTGLKGVMTAGCFGWTAEALTERLTSVPHYFGGFVDEAPLPAVSRETEISRGCGWFSKLPLLTPLSFAINRAI